MSINKVPSGANFSSLQSLSGTSSGSATISGEKHSEGLQTAADAVPIGQIGFNKKDIPSGNDVTITHDAPKGTSTVAQQQQSINSGK